MKKVSANAIMATAATVTAVAALAVAVWDNAQSREYNRLSVRPYLQIEASRSTTGERDRGEFRLSNEGVGPGIVSGVGLHLRDGKSDSYETWGDIATELRAEEVIVTGWTDLVPGQPLGVDRSQMLFSFEIGVEEGRPAGRSVQDIFESLSIQVLYESIYGDAFTAEWPPKG
jgi:hypothetical protein